MWLIVHGHRHLFWVSLHRITTNYCISPNVILSFVQSSTLYIIYSIASTNKLVFYFLIQHLRRLLFKEYLLPLPVQRVQGFLWLFCLSTTPVYVPYSISKRPLFHSVQTLNLFFNIWCLWGTCTVVNTLKQTLLTMKIVTNTCLMCKYANML